MGFESVDAERFVNALARDFRSLELPHSEAAMLEYARKLTVQPHEVGEGDVQRLRGWLQRSCHTRHLRGGQLLLVRKQGSARPRGGARGAVFLLGGPDELRTGYALSPLDITLAVPSF